MNQDTKKEKKSQQEASKRQETASQEADAMQLDQLCNQSEKRLESFDSTMLTSTHFLAVVSIGI